MIALQAYAAREIRGTYPLFTVDDWKTDSSALICTVATANERAVAQAAYEAATATLPHASITLRDGIRLIRSSAQDRENEAWRKSDFPRR